MYVLYQAYYKASTVLIIYGYTFIWICCSNKSDDICHSHSHFHAVCVTGLGVLNRFLNSTDPHNDILRWHQQLRLIIQCSCLHSELTVAVTGQHSAPHDKRLVKHAHLSQGGHKMAQSVDERLNISCLLLDEAAKTERSTYSIPAIHQKTRI